MLPGKVYEVKFHFTGNDHTFLPGHRIALQVQSSLFPVIARNPQTFVENIFEAKDSDFRPAKIEVVFGARPSQPAAPAAQLVLPARCALRESHARKEGLPSEALAQEGCTHSSVTTRRPSDRRAPVIRRCACSRSNHGSATPSGRPKSSAAACPAATIKSSNTTFAMPTGTLRTNVPEHELVHAAATH